MEKGDKAGKPHAHLEAIPASTIWKCLVVIPSHIPKSNESLEICEDKLALFCRNLVNSIKSLPQQEGKCIRFVNIQFLGGDICIFLVFISLLSWKSHYGSITGVIIESYQGFTGKVNWLYSNPTFFPVGCIMWQFLQSHICSALFFPIIVIQLKSS